MGSGSVYAGAVEAPAETISVLGMYVQKIAKVGFYIDTIAESVSYVGSVGKKGFNAAVGALSSVVGDLGGFQDMLHFADASSFNSLLNKANTAVDTVTDQVEEVENVVDNATEEIGAVKAQVDKAQGVVEGKAQELVDAGKEVIEEGKNAAKDVVDELGAEEAIDDVKNRINKAVSGDQSQEDSSSAYARVGTVQTTYGAPQDNKTAADAYVRKMFFYSTKEGDKYDGKPLSETTQADEAVKKNRNKYRAEVISTAYATALESRTAGLDASLKRYETIRKKVASAASEDEKRAVGALITQEKTRQRVARLSLDLALLEQDVVNDVLEQPTEIIIARTVEQINAETEAANKDVSFESFSNDLSQEDLKKALELKKQLEKLEQEKNKKEDDDKKDEKNETDKKEVKKETEKTDKKGGQS